MDGRDGDAVQDDLRAVLARAGDPRALLALGPDAAPDAIRRAFHALCKRYHPTRFARSSPETLRLANEAFLAIKRAHDELMAAPGLSDATPAGPILARGTTATATGDRGARPRPAVAAPRPPASTPPATTAAVGTSPPRAAAATSPPPVRTPLASPPPAAAPPRSVRFADTRSPPLASAAPRATTMPIPVIRSGPAPIREPAPAAGSPAAVAPAAIASPAPPRVPGGSQAIPRPTGVSQAIPRSTGASQAIPRPTAPRAARPTDVPQAPSTIPPPVAPARPMSGPTAAIPAAADEEGRADAALDLLRRRLWKDAEAAYGALATGHPAERRYRAYRHYARGRVLQDEGQLDAARTEWERALRTDPGLAIAQSAIDTLPEPPKPTGGGLLSRLFKR